MHNPAMSEMDDLHRKLDELVEARMPFRNGEKVFVFGEEDRQRLERAFGMNFQDAEDMIQQMLRLSSLNVGGIYVQLTPNLIERLKSRAFSMDFDKFVSMIVRRSLEAHVGLR
jgi:hypothetical protein